MIQIGRNYLLDDITIILVDVNVTKLNIKPI